MNRRERDYARDMRRRDRAMRREDMARRRNARGQYMSDRGMDYGRRDYNDMRGSDYRQSSRGRDYGSHEMYPDERYDRGYERNREYRGTYGNTPFYMNETQRYEHDMRRGDYGDMARSRDYADYGDYARGGRRDYGDMRDYGECLSKDDLEDWIEELMQELDHEEKEVFKMDKVIHKAEEMGVEFKHFNKHEFYALVLALYDDYKKTIGKNSIEMTILLSRDWMNDKDSALKGGEKLCAYFDEIVNAD